MADERLAFEEAVEEATSSSEKVESTIGIEVLQVIEGVPVLDVLSEAYCLDDNVLRALEGAWEPDGKGPGVDANMCLVLAHSLRCSLALRRASRVMR
jgi:hypothetical protein